MQTVVNVWEHALAVHLEIVLGQLEVLERIDSNVNGVHELWIVEGTGIDGLAFWQALSELLSETDESHDAADQLLQVLGLPGLLEFLDSLVKNNDGLALILEALTKLFKVEVATEALEDALKNEEQVLSSVVGNGELTLLTDEDLGSSLADVEAEAIVVSWILIVIFDRCLQLLVDAVAVDDEVLADMNNG